MDIIDDHSLHSFLETAGNTLSSREGMYGLEIQMVKEVLREKDSEIMEVLVKVVCQNMQKGNVAYLGSRILYATDVETFVESTAIKMPYLAVIEVEQRIAKEVEGRNEVWEDLPDYVEGMALLTYLVIVELHAYFQMVSYLLCGCSIVRKMEILKDVAV